MTTSPIFRGDAAITSLRVLHIGKYFPPHAGGMETYLRDLAAAQAAQGLDSSALVHASFRSLRRASERYSEGERNLSVTRAAVWFRVLFTPISPTFPLLLSRLIKEKRPDLLHLHLPNASAFWALVLPRARRLPWVVHWHADVLTTKQNVAFQIFYRFYKHLESSMLKRSKAIIVTSPPYLEYSLPLSRFRDKCHIVPLGIDPATLPRVRKKLRAEDQQAPLRVLAIGRLTYYKGFEYLISAAAVCEDIEVHLVGTGELEEDLKKLVIKLGLQHRVTFYGYLPTTALAEQLISCDCLSLPSTERTEAFGLVLLEAMHYRKAGVVSDIPGSGVGWVVDNGITGIHVTPASVTDLAESLRCLHHDREKLKQLGTNGYQKFHAQFHISKSAEAVSKVYREIQLYRYPTRP